MRRFVTTFIACCVTTSAFAGAHLEPEDAALTISSPFHGNYGDVLQRVFKDAFDRSVVAVEFVVPEAGSLGQPEFAVGVKYVGDYRIFTLESPVQLEQYDDLARLKSGEIRYALDNERKIEELEHALHGSPENLPIARCEYPIAPALGRNIVTLWRAMLLNTRFYEYVPILGRDGKPDTQTEVVTGLDNGVRFHFMQHELVGQTYRSMSHEWAVRFDASDLGKFVAIGDTMRDACRTKRADFLTTLDRRVGELRSRVGNPSGRD